MISELVNTVHLTGSFLDKKYTRQTEEKLDETGARLENLLCKSIT
jgi:hypothetical protein